jgi:O-antigen/teichoic acid export membrane protein
VAVSESPRTSVDEPLGRRAASGVLWLAAQKWAVRASGLATLVVLTRHVSPHEFGVVAAAMTVIPLIYLLSDLGFSTFLLQAEDVGRTSLSTAFWASVAAGAALSTGLWFAAPLIAEAFRSPELVAVLRALVLAVVPTVLSAVPLALLRRAMRFRAVAVQSLVAALLAQVAAVVVALRDGGVWALVAQVVVTQWVIGLLAWLTVRWAPSFTLSPGLFREMATFGVRVSTVDLVSASRQWAESWVITVSLGPAALGLLSIAQRLVLVVQELAAASLVPVSTVLFARVRDSVDRLRTSYVKGLGVAYAVVAPLMVLVVVTAPDLVPLLFGDQWRPSVGPAQALAVAGVVTLGAMLDHGLFYGLGRPGTWLAYATVVELATLGTTVVAVRWGLTGVALGFVVVAVLATSSRWVVVARLLDLPVGVVARPFLTMVVPTTLVAGVGLGTFELVREAVPPWVAVGVTGLATAAVHLFLLRVLAHGVVRDALGILPAPDSWVRRLHRLLRLGSAEGDGAARASTI